MRDTWKLLNNVLNDTLGTGIQPTVTKIIHNNQIIDDKKIIADKFNDYFVNIGPNLAKAIHPETTGNIKDTLPAPNKNSIFLNPCTTYEITDIVSNLKNSKGIGLDGFSTTVVKKVITQISEPLTKIFNKSLETGVFPQKLKLAKVIPVYKTEDKLLVNNYRPISVLPVFSKILEKIMYSRLEIFINKHNILCNNQFGFRENHSTYMALLDIIDTITQQLDNKSYALGVFIDLSKAFDTIDHSILLHKLENYGIRGTALSWFKSYLSNRMQMVDIDLEVSSLKTITCGVPQGSILGPLLFILYINDITNVSPQMKLILFADDTNILLNDTNLTDLISKTNTELQKISHWLKINKLSLNIKKTHFILFHFRQHKIPENIKLLIDDDVIERVQFTKFLGVIVHENLTWENHISCLSRKIHKGLGILKSLQSKLPSTSLFMLYNTLIYPYLQYCNIAWASQHTTHVESLVKLQKKALRIVCKKRWDAHTQPIFKLMGTLKLNDINRLQTACFVYKAINNELSQIFSGYFVLNKNIHEHYTRQSHKVHINKVRTTIRKFSIKNYGPTIWDSLPDFLKVKPSLHSFKHSYKHYILSNY
jgi:hypothetical protein